MQTDKRSRRRKTLSLKQKPEVDRKSSKTCCGWATSIFRRRHCRNSWYDLHHSLCAPSRWSTSQSHVSTPLSLAIASLPQTPISLSTAGFVSWRLRLTAINLPQTAASVPCSFFPAPPGQPPSPPPPRLNHRRATAFPGLRNRQSRP